MLNLYTSRELHEDRVSELKKDYEASDRKVARKPLKWIKKMLKRDQA